MTGVAIIGIGAIGQYVHRALRDSLGLDAVGSICRPGREGAARDMLGPAVSVATSIDALAFRPNFVVDCGGHQALIEHGPSILAAGIDVITVSVGALADMDLAETLESAARQGDAQLELVSGAIGAIDALSAARVGGLDYVRYTGRKPPQGWRGSPAENNIDLSSLDKAVTHFNGSAREAARLYPKNANVAATVALAGLGLDETEATLIADPAAAGNIHEVEAKGAFGQFVIRLEGNPLPDNPKSSALTGMSVVRAIRNRIDAISI